MWGQRDDQRTVFPLRLAGGNLFNVGTKATTKEQCFLCVLCDSQAGISSMWGQKPPPKNSVSSVSPAIRRRESLQCGDKSHHQKTVFPLCPLRFAGGNLFNVGTKATTKKQCFPCVPCDSQAESIPRLGT